jgi:pimeloyl-ACP methyl ester carboxylesterase
LARYYEQKFTWRRCNGQMLCATMKVPISYAQPTKYGDTYIKVAKLPAWGKRRGAIIINPGGPGGSGIDYASAGDAVVSASVLRYYDLVGFDPRGVGQSDPIDCVNDAQLDAFLAFDASPDTAAESTTAMSLAGQLGRGCVRNAPVLSKFVDTESVARDMDVLRGVLGETKLNYLGKSYGTFIGSTYARLFSARVGRMVLDGVVDPALSNTHMSMMQAMGFERAFDRFLSYCLRQGCPLGATRTGAVTRLKSIVAASDSTPIPTSDPSRPLTQSLLVSGLLFGMYDSNYGWSQVLESLRGVVNGDGDDMLSTVDWFLGRENGRYKDNSNEIIYAVNCIDRQDRPGVTQIRQLATAWGKEYPLFGRYLAWTMAGCADWPAPAVGNAAPWRGRSIPPVLIIGNTWDPATPVEGARSLASQMPGSVLMEWKGDGHTAYTQGSGCVDDYVNAYFNDGVLPRSGTVCQ